MNKAFVFDFDDTLANTACHVIVRDSMGVAYKSITPAEFNTYKLGNGESFDFSEFRDEIFIHAANPTWLMALAKEVAAEGHAIYILTAREHCVADSIHAWLMGHGIDATEIHCVGGDKDSIPVNKKQILLDIVEKYDKIYFYDDHEDNVNIFQHEKLRNYLV
jgi:phosphoserine phosphatase